MLHTPLSVVTKPENINSFSIIQSPATVSSIYQDDENLTFQKRFSLTIVEDPYCGSDDKFKKVPSSTGFMAAGSINSSTLNLVAATMGAGTITMPYIISLTGIAFGSFLIIVGAILSNYSGMLLIKCTQLTNLKTYEDFAEAAFGSKKWRSLVSIFTMVSLLGFTTAYISLSKTLIPSIAVAQVGVENAASLPYWLQVNATSKIVWATVFSFGILFPMACFRELSMLRFTSMLGVTCSLVLMLVLAYEYLLNKELVPEPAAQFKHAEYVNASQESIINAVPFIIFLYMYQPNIPQTYSELADKRPKTMQKVLMLANCSAVIVYLLVGIIGYLIFADKAYEQLQSPEVSRNILEAEFNGASVVQFARYLILVAVISAAPLAILPAKYAYEELIYKHIPGGMTNKQNTMVALVMTLFCYISAVMLPNVGSVIAITGATVNPFIGFIFPILFYLKLDPSAFTSKSKLFAIFVMLTTIAVSILGLIEIFSVSD